MSCVGDQHASVYRPRSPQASPLYQLLDTHFPEFEEAYAEKYAERYGPWRPAIARAVADYVKCGDLREGFARVHCPRCGHDLFVALSCRCMWRGHCTVNHFACGVVIFMWRGHCTVNHLDTSDYTAKHQIYWC